MKRCNSPRSMSHGLAMAAACLAALALLALAPCGEARAAGVTGDPAADGWALNGHSLAKDTYVKGSANYGYNAYGMSITVASGSALDITDTGDSSLSWLAGDTVVGVGGVFQTITASAAGWTTGFTGGSVNNLLPASSGPKLQAKFGTANATWYTSDTAPNAGDGNSSSSNGGGRVQVRTSGYFQTGTPTPGQTEPWTWDGNSGQLLVLDKDTHIDWDGASSQPPKQVARMIWIWDGSAGQVASWELLLNVSLLQRVAPGDFTGLFPAPGDLAVMTVQDGDGAYTDALVTTVPEPATMGLLGLGLAALVSRARRRK